MADADITKKILLQLDIDVNTLNSKLVSSKLQLDKETAALLELKKQLKDFVKAGDTIGISNTTQQIALQENGVKKLRAEYNNYQRQLTLVNTVNESAAGSFEEQRASIALLNKTIDTSSAAELKNNAVKQEQLKLLTQLRAGYQADQAALNNFTPGIGDYTNKVGSLSRVFRGLGGLGRIVSTELGIDPAVAIGVQELGRAFRDLNHIKEGGAKIAGVNKAATQAETAATTEQTVAQEAGTVATDETVVATEAQTVATEESTVATGIFSRALLFLESINPFALIIAGAIALGAAITGVIYYLTKQTDAQKALEAVNIKAIEGYTVQETKIKTLISTAQNLNASYATREQAVAEAKKAGEGYLDGLTVENSLSKEVADTINNQLIPALKAKATAEAAQTLFNDAIQKQTELETEHTTAIGQTTLGILSQTPLISFFFSTQSKKIADAKEQVDAYTEAWQKANEEIGKYTSAEALNESIASSRRTGVSSAESALNISKIGSQSELAAKLSLIKQKESDDLAMAQKITDIDERNSKIKEIYTKANKEEALLQQDFDDKQLKAAQEHALALAKLKHDSGEDSDETFEAKEFKIKSDTLVSEQKLYTNNLDKQKEISTSLINLNADRVKQIKDNTQKSEDETLKAKQEALKSTYDEQLSALNDFHSESQIEISENNLKKLVSEKSYQQNKLQIDIDAEKEKYNKLPSNTDGTKSIEQTSQQNRITALTDTQKSQQVADQQKINDELNKLSDAEYQQALKDSNDYYSKEKDSLTDKFVSGKIGYREYQDGLTKINNDALKTRQNIETDYSNSDIKAFNDLSKTKADKAAQAVTDAEKAAALKIEIDKKYYSESIGLINEVSAALKESEREELSNKNLTAQQKKEIEKKYAGYSLAITSAKIIANTAEAVSGNTKYGVAAIPLDAIAIATGAVEEGIAIAQYNKVMSMAKGGYYSNGRGSLLRGEGTGTSDSINAHLSNGESVINARSTKMFLPQLSAINQAGGGVKFADGGYMSHTATAGAGQEHLLNTINDTLKNAPPPRVSVYDIIRATDYRTARVDDRINF